MKHAAEHSTQARHALKNTSCKCAAHMHAWRCAVCPCTGNWRVRHMRACSCALQLELCHTHLCSEAFKCSSTPPRTSPSLLGCKSTSNFAVTLCKQPVSISLTSGRQVQGSGKSVMHPIELLKEVNVRVLQQCCTHSARRQFAVATTCTSGFTATAIFLTYR